MDSETYLLSSLMVNPKVDDDDEEAAGGRQVVRRASPVA